MGVEDVAGIGLAARRAAEQQRQLAIGHGLLGQVVVDAEGGHPLLVHEVLGHRRPGVGGKVLERGRVAGSRGDDDRVIHRPLLAQVLDQAGRGRLLLGNRDIDADDPGPLLAEDRIDRDGGLAGLPVADDELALPPADRGHGVDRLDPGLHRLVDRLAVGDPGGGRLDQPGGAGGDRPLVVDRLAQRVDDPADHRLADRDAEQLAGRRDGLPFVDRRVFAQDDDADRGLFEVQGQPLDARLEGDHLAVHHAGEAVDPRDPVADLQDAPDLGPRDLRLELLDLTLDN